MALDWKKEVSFGKNKGAKAPKGDPVKDYINLAGTEKKQGSVKSIVLKVLIGVVVLALIAKFGIFDLFASVDAKRTALATEKQSLSAIQSQLLDYDEIADEYETYGIIGSSKDGEEPVDIVDAMELVHTIILPKASVGAIDLNGDTLTLVLNNVTLRDVGAITNALNEADAVKDVSVNTAGSQDPKASAEIVTATMKIHLFSKEEQKKIADAKAQQNATSSQGSASNDNSNQQASGSNENASSNTADTNSNAASASSGNANQATG